MEIFHDQIFSEMIDKFRSLKDIPRFIAIEGPEGAGKTTQAKFLSMFLKKAGYRIVLVKDPGSTPLGERIRKILKTSSFEIDSVSELFLFLAARRQLVVDVIRPSLRQGKVVIADRFTHSTLAYQGRARGIMPETLPMLCYIATGGIEPEIVIVLDIEPEKGLERVRKRYGWGGESEEDRFEREDIEFHMKVREYYIEIAQRESNVFIVKADMEPHEVLRSVLTKIYDFAVGKI